MGLEWVRMQSSYDFGLDFSWVGAFVVELILEVRYKTAESELNVYKMN